MNRQPISRRHLLKGVGAVVALPWLEAMLPRVARADAAFAAAQPTRLAYLYVPNGMHMSDFTPTALGKNFELTPILQPLVKFQKDMNVLSGLTLNGARALGDGPGDHARAVAAFLTGAHPKKSDGTDIRNGVSIDQEIAKQIGSQTRLPSLEIGMEQSAAAGNCDSGYSCVYSSNMSWRDDTTPVPKEVNPAALFDRLFGPAAGSGESTIGPSLDKRRQSILDFVQADAGSLAKKLGANDRHRVDQYLSAIREIELRIGHSEKLAGHDTDSPEYPRPKGVPRDFEQHMHLLFDIMTLAFETDSTRLMTFMYANAGSNRSYRNLSIDQGHHDLSHHGNEEDKQKKISQINQYHATLFSYFLERLATTKVGGDRLLDHTLVVYGSGISDGNRHNHDDLPILLMGGRATGLPTGRHLKFKRDTPLTNLYLSLASLCGAKLDKFGDSTGTLDDELLS